MRTAGNNTTKKIIKIYLTLLITTVQTYNTNECCIFGMCNFETGHDLQWTWR